MQRITYEWIVINDEQAGADVRVQWLAQYLVSDARRISSIRV